MESLQSLAQANFTGLCNNSYPGRGVVAGLNETGEYLVQIYWIMGRSENSRNRVFKQEEEIGRLYTEAADAAKVKDSSLIIYNAMREFPPYYAVSNGSQTDTVVDQYEAPFYLDKALNGVWYEPDEPNFTQRITAVTKLDISGAYIMMSILRKSMFGPRCDKLTYHLNPHPGFGFCITTYAGDGDPLPPFQGDPLLIPLKGGYQEILQTYWDALNKENRVAIAVKWIERGNGRSDIYLINKYNQVG